MTTPTEATDTAPTEDSLLRYDFDRAFWHEQLGRFDLELGIAGDNHPFDRHGVGPENILDAIRGGDDEFESEMLDAAQTMIDCRLSLSGVGPPPRTPAGQYDDLQEAAMDADVAEDLNRYDAYMEACVSYEAAGKLFARGIELRNLEILKAAYPFVRDGDRVLCNAGYQASFSPCRGR